jgi:hypothetical protein
MIVKAAPLFATILCRWLGRLAIPIGDALSTALPAGIVKVGYVRVKLFIEIIALPRKVSAVIAT